MLDWEFEKKESANKPEINKSNTIVSRLFSLFQKNKDDNSKKQSTMAISDGDLIKFLLWIK